MPRKRLTVSDDERIRSGTIGTLHFNLQDPMGNIEDFFRLRKCGHYKPEGPCRPTGYDSGYETARHAK